MATTSKWGIPLVNDSTPAAPLQALLNATATALDSALTALESDVSVALGAGANLLSGTATQRNASTTAKSGQLWQDTSSPYTLWRRQGSAWVRLLDPAAAPFAMAAGSVPAATIPSNGAIETAITFPAGRFTVTPIVTVTQGGSPTRDVSVGHKTVTKDGFRLMRGTDGTQRAGITATWTAVQMTPTAAAG